MGVLFQGYGRGAKATALSARYSRALNLAESLLAGSGVENDLVEGERSGETDDGFRWVERISPNIDEMVGESAEDLEANPTVVLFAVEVEAGWEQGTNYRAVTLHSLRLGTP